MKPKTFEKKLTLNKKTITHLSSSELGKMNGGGTSNNVCIYTECTCPFTCRETCSIGLDYACCAPPIAETDTCLFTKPGTPC